LFSSFVYSQQSLGLSKRPKNVSIGSINSKNINSIVIAGVPKYLWYRGCGPTALGMLTGYYDSMGYPDLVVGDASTQTNDVNNMMASSLHYSDYSQPLDYYPNLKQDKSQLGGAHSSNSIADYMNTSWSSRNNYWGWSWMTDMGPAMVNYTNQQNDNYDVITHNVFYNANSWLEYKNEIDNNRPVILLVDSDGDSSTDHFVIGIGYNETTHEYAIYDTWDTSIHWYNFRAMSSSYSWGIYGFTKISLSQPMSINSIKDVFSIYPNPTLNSINIQSTSRLIDFHYELYNVLGNKVKIGKSLNIDISSFNSGVYILKIYNNNIEISKKIIKSSL
jgi:hypothetical protein